MNNALSGMASITASSHIAGGSITTLTGDEFDVFVPSLLAASTATLRQELVAAFR